MDASSIESDWVTENQQNDNSDWVDENQSHWYSNPQTISSLARPIIETTGAVGGGIIGSGLGPFGTAGGGALGFGVGKSAADLLDRSLGVKAPIQTVQQGLGEAAQNAYQGAQFEATNLAAGPVIKAAINNPLTRGIGKVGSMLGEWAGNVPAKDYKVIFKNPEGVLPGSLERASTNFETASKNAGIPSEMSPDQLDSILGPKARKIVKQSQAGL